MKTEWEEEIGPEFRLCHMSVCLCWWRRTKQMGLSRRSLHTGKHSSLAFWSILIISFDNKHINNVCWTGYCSLCFTHNATRFRFFSRMKWKRLQQKRRIEPSYPLNHDKIDKVHNLHWQAPSHLDLHIRDTHATGTPKRCFSPTLSLSRFSFLFNFPFGCYSLCMWSELWKSWPLVYLGSRAYC